MKQAVVEFDHFAPDGAAVATYGRKSVCAFGVLPGEQARVEIYRSRRGCALGRAKEIFTRSPKRIQERESHYLSCSPWQIVDYPAQIEFKREILEALFAQATGRPVSVDRFYTSDLLFEYRNKLEFSFLAGDNGLALAFFERGTPFRKVPLPKGCLLGSEKMNQAALEVARALAVRGIKPTALKSLIVRESKTTQDIVSALFVRTESFLPLDLELTQSSGLLVVYSNPQSPASRIGRILAATGKDHLTEKILDLEIEYPFDGFFQNHVALFEQALQEIRKYVPRSAQVLELYAGVGVIGLAVARHAKKVSAVESHPASMKCAKHNQQRNNVSNLALIEAQVEELESELFRKNEVFLLDPPRSGIHPRVMKRIKAAKPERIIYLSCHPSQQARDFSQLNDEYRVVTLLGFDFYPQTPHIESLLVLERL